MKLSVSKNTNMLTHFTEAVSERIYIVRASLIYNIQEETAYFADLWGNMVSTLFYILATIVFVDILYANVDTIASYTRAEMLLYIFIGQVGFYILWGVSYSGLDSLIEDVRKGDLDLVLLKPLPTLFYLETRRFRIIRMIRDGVAPMLVISFVVPWNELALEPHAVIAGIIIMIIGYICLHIYMLFFSLPVFWIGESRNFFSLA